MTIKKIIIIFAAAAICFPAMIRAAVPEYTVKRATGKIVIDGLIEEEDWKAALPFGDFKFPWYTSGEKEQTEAKMLWDDEFLYLYYKCRDKNVSVSKYNLNDGVSVDDAVEIFWNPNPGAQTRYYQFEINCIGNLLSVLNTGTSPRPTIMVPKRGHVIYGTVNNESDMDSLWTMEIAIRFSDYPEILRAAIPVSGDMWRIGLNRCGGKVNAQYSQWSPSNTPTPQFHSPDDYGKIYFSSEPVRTVTTVTGPISSLPNAIKISGNYPNPFNPSTVIEFSLSAPGSVTLDIFNIANQKVRTLVSGALSARAHSVRWDGKDGDGAPVSSGVFISRLKMGNTAVYHKMLMIK